MNQPARKGSTVPVESDGKTWAIAARLHARAAVGLDGRPRRRAQSGTPDRSDSKSTRTLSSSADVST